MTWEAMMPIIETVVGAAVTIAMAFVTLYIRTRIAAIKDEQTRKFAEVAVNAVEQLARNNEVAEKYEAAKARLQEYLKGKGIVLTDEQIESYIEAAVNKLQPIALEYDDEDDEE